ncbi:hypothetical protein MTP99_000728 [Tenebrio molitor]|nr:hypothetical protein MTP99_000728 [Tenebrio molitor]
MPTSCLLCLPKFENRHHRGTPDRPSTLQKNARRAFLTTVAAATAAVGGATVTGDRSGRPRNNPLCDHRITSFGLEARASTCEPPHSRRVFHMSPPTERLTKYGQWP